MAEESDSVLPIASSEGRIANYPAAFSCVFGMGVLVVVSGLMGDLRV